MDLRQCPFSLSIPHSFVSQESLPESPFFARPHLLRRLYDWVLHWANTPYGTPALALIAFVESSFFPIPPDVLQIALSASRPKRSFFYAFISTAGSVAGAIVGWFIGYTLWTTASGFFYTYVPGITPESMAYVGELYHDNAALALFGAAFTPIPFKVFAIAAGVFSEYVSLQTLIIMSIIGRSVRFFLVATCMYFFGPHVKVFIERYFNILSLVLFVLVVLGFVVIKYAM